MNNTYFFTLFLYFLPWSSCTMNHEVLHPCVGGIYFYYVHFLFLYSSKLVIFYYKKNLQSKQINLWFTIFTSSNPSWLCLWAKLHPSVQKRHNFHTLIKLNLELLFNAFGFIFKKEINLNTTIRTNLCLHILTLFWMRLKQGQLTFL